MTEERVTERSDGVTTERTIERGEPTHVVVERRGGAGTVIAVLAVIALAIAAYFLFLNNNEERTRTEAISGAAEAVEGAANDVGDAAEKAVDGE